MTNEKKERKVVATAILFYDDTIPVYICGASTLLASAAGAIVALTVGFAEGLGSGVGIGRSTFPGVAVTMLDLVGVAAIDDFAVDGGRGGCALGLGDTEVVVAVMISNVLTGSGFDGGGIAVIVASTT
jgi:hypothetical protein